MSLEITKHTPDFATVAQISPDHVSEIAALGFKSVIDNRPDFEGGPDQPVHDDLRKIAESHGMVFAYLPVVSTAITQQQVQEMAELIEDLPKPILAFCRSGARSTNLYLMAKQLGE